MIKSTNQGIERQLDATEPGQLTRWTFLNEGEAAKQADEFRAELAKAPAAVRNAIEQAETILDQLTP